MSAQNVANQVIGPMVKVIAPATQPVADAVNAWTVAKPHWPAQADILAWAQNMGPATAAMLILAGIIYLTFGIHLYRGLITLNAAVVGIFLGALIGARAGNQLAGAMVVGCLVAAITWPGMKYAVAIMGGIFGILLGASIWRAMGLEPQYVWAGGVIGLIFFGMLSFIIFRGSIMMFCSVQGAVMLVFGILGMLYKYQSVASLVSHNLSIKPFILPLAVFIPAVIGLIYQHAQFPPPRPETKSRSEREH